MAVDIATEVASKLFDLLVGPVGRQIGYAWNCKDYIESLKGEVKTLKEARDRLQRRVTDARKGGENIENDVKGWLKDANEFIERADEFLRAEDTINKQCFGVQCPDYKTRYQRGRKAKKGMLKEVAALCTRKEEIHGVSYRVKPQVLWPVKRYETFNSRIPIFKDVMQALVDPNVNKIGLYGINGVGKTTFVTEIARQAKENNFFDEVVITTVFQDRTMKEMQREVGVVKQTPDVGRIQKEIAEGLDFTFHFEMESRRAAELHERLKDESRKLLVLDNIWAGLELDDLGIPNDHEGCKILMASTNQKVLSSQMGSQKNFLLDTLPFDEAWDWFRRMVGHVLEVPGLEEVAIQVADRCAGLPILLIPVAKVLKDNINLDAWKEALKQLSSFDKEEMHAHVDSALQLSYNLLDSDEIKSLFLLCGQYAFGSIPIEGLFRHSFGMGLLKQSNTLVEGRAKLLKWINDLKDSCLLLEGNRIEEVKMHEIVRSFAVSVAARDRNYFTIAPYTTLVEWPAADVLENLTAVCLGYCKMPDLPEVFECPKLELFSLANNDPSFKIPDSFFLRMKKLKVLFLVGVCFLELPPSFKNLENLRTLGLGFCILKDITIIRKLKKLQILSLEYSDIIKLPKEIGQLSSLRLLDLSHCKRLEVIPPNLLSSLAQLEELCMENTCVEWDFEGQNTERTNASLAELKHLPNLSTIDIHVTNAKMLPRGLFFENLVRFRIFIGDGWNWWGKYKTSRTLKIKLNTSIKWEKGLKGLLNRTEDLYLDELKGIRSSLYELDVLGFRQLKHLHVENSSVIQFIVNSNRMEPCVAFTRLESLFIDNLPNLKKICDGQLMPESFSNLRILEVGSCDSLENVVSLSMARALLHLEEIRIADCKNLKEIVTEESEDDADKDEIVQWPQLRKMVLDSLPQFSRFCSKMKAHSLTQTRHGSTETTLTLKEIVHETETETPMPFFHERILIPNLKELRLSSIIIDNIWNEHILDKSSGLQNLAILIVDGCDNLKYLFPSIMVESLVNLKTLQVINCRMMEHIIIMEGFGDVTSHVTFRQLDVLQIENLPKLRMFVSMLGMENAQVSNEPELTNFCLFDEKVAFPNLEGLAITNMKRVKMIWHNELHDNSFSKLKRLSISNAEQLVKVFPSTHALGEFKNVEFLSIALCNSLEEIFSFEAMTNTTLLSVAAKLKTLQLNFLPNLKHIWNKDAAEILSFPDLFRINVFGCQNLRSVFPASVARGLSKLTFLYISDCGVEEIVSKEDRTRELILDFEFPQLIDITLWRLPELKRFYPGIHTSEFPKLKYLKVYGCPQVELFTSEPQDFQEQCFEGQIENLQQQPLFTAEKVIPTLEELPLNGNDVRMLWEGQLPADLFSKVKILVLHSVDDESTMFPFFLIQKLNNMEQLCVGSSYFKEIFPDDGFADLGNHLEKVRLLRFDSLYNMKWIKLDHVEKNLVTLEVWNCNSLTKLAPPSASFQNLIVLDVQNCKRLVSLMTLSTATGLVQLTKLIVRNCKVLKEILANEGHEERAEITFRKLESLRLDCLTSLTNFHSEVSTLRFPSLEEVILKQCPKMTKFSQGVLHAPKLRRVQTEGRDKTRWMGDLNATVQQLYMDLTGFDGLWKLKLSKFPELKGRWFDNLPVRFFDKLWSLVVDDCASYSSAIPPNLLPALNGLKVLEVRNCNSVEEVFDIRQPNAPRHTKHLPELTMFLLVDLPKLKHVWTENAKGMLEFGKLKMIKIQKCGSLRYIFTPSMLLGLCQLEVIEIKSCPVIEEIVAKEVAHDSIISKIILPVINSISLEDLPNLTSFYSGNGIIEFSCLKMVAIVDCPKAFTSGFLRGQEQSTSGEATEVKVVFPCLEKLRVVWDDAMAKFIQADFFCKLKVFELAHFPDDLAAFPSHIFQRLTSLENLELSDATFKEIALHEETNNEDYRLEIPAQIKKLKLTNCLNLKLLVPLLVSFERLTVLRVSKCHGLVNLISSSTAKTLVQLTKLSISECISMIEIMTEEKEMAENGIIFRKLKCLRLQCLPSLTSFYSGKCALMFPDLEEVCLSDCPKIEAFSQGDVKMPKLKILKLAEEEDKGFRETSHYTHLQQLFRKMKQAVALTKSPSLPRHQSLDFERTCAEKVQETVVSKDMASEILHASKVSIEEETKRTCTREVEIIDLDSDSPAALNIKKDSAEGACNSMESGDNIPSENLNDSEAVIKDEVSPDSSMLHLIAKIDELLRPTSSSKLPTSTNGGLPDSVGINPEHTHGDHLCLLKRILMRPLSEVSRSQDVLLLRSTLENLKSCPHLTSQQKEIIQYYIEHFHTLVTYHPSYEDQIARASALQLSVQGDVKGISELRSLYGNLAKKAVTIRADMEALKKKLEEVEEEDKQVRADMEGLYAELVMKNEKLNALPIAAMLQNEAENKARSANDQWTKIRDLFA